MNNAIYTFKKPENEPVLQYLPGSKERILLDQEIERQMNTEVEIPLIIGGKEVKTGKMGKVVMPSNHQHVLATYHKAGKEEVEMAVEAAMAAKQEWLSLSWVERASIMMKAAELISTKYRYMMNAATMLGQSKNIYQAEIDSACETIDFFRYNAYFLQKIYSAQPEIGKGNINRLEYRPLEGFVLSVTPFNFTAIASNLNASVALMGNTTLWKPATTALLSGYYLMKVYKEAGFPDGVINFLPGPGSVVGGTALSSADLAGIHFTGSTGTFNHLWKKVGENLDSYKSYPRLVGETGGKDFIFVHNSAKAEEVATAITTGGYEYQGQKCSAASRIYVPQSMWAELKELLVKMVGEIKMGCVTDPNNFMNAVIDEASFDNIMSYIEYAKESSEAEIIIGGKGDKSVGYFVEPTVILTTNPKFKSMEEEIFGPVVTIYVYEDDKYEETLKLCDETSPYALTGSIFANDRYALDKAFKTLEYAAGNFYFNDKPSGAVVGLQPFGGARKSGTNDKAGSELNLFRWVNPRTIKETLVSPTTYKYGYMDK